ncbi:Integrator complex subunit 10 [Acropora cervicornis]|uniref:Integrator complex subunit 10 n=1 Tax=Acropora cervicornis TaxID=6130 RepID=A0AAD9R5R9_ACRCE|nr:Integrator complex subunit 10 [Acropora cervicornis]
MADKADTCEADSQWLVERARQSLRENNPFEAKAWLITAKTLYPKDFGVQYEAYSIERNDERVQEAAKLFYQMFEQFPSSDLLWKEVENFTNALESEVVDKHSKFLTVLSIVYQFYFFLKKIFCFADAEMTNDKLYNLVDSTERTCLAVYHNMHKEGYFCKLQVNLTEMLIDAGNKEYPSTPVNPYRKLLVCDVLPHLLASNNLKVDVTRQNGKDRDSQDDEDDSSGISVFQVYRWLKLSIQFYVACATVHNSVPEGFDTSHGSAVDNSIIAEVLDCKGPWVALHELFYLVAKKCGWIEICKIHDRLDPQKYRSSSDHWSSISELHHKLKKMFKHNLEGDIEKDLQEKTGVMFAVTILFLQTVWEYCHVVNRLDSVSSSGVVHPLVFIEDVTEDNKKSSEGGDTSPAPKKKKKKVTSSGHGSPGKEEGKSKQMLHVLVDKSCGSVNQSISDDFSVSVDAWHLLNTYTGYKTDFTRLSGEWNMERWTWLTTFHIDRLIYKGKYKKAVDYLQEQRYSLEQDTLSNQELLARGAVQLSCCYFQLDDNKRACEEALYALQLFLSRASPADNITLKRSTSVHQGKLDSSETELSTTSSLQGRCLRLIPCTESEVVSFSVRLLLSSLKQRLASEGRNDTLIGHLIVLLQYDWPKEEGTFYELLEKIRDNRGLKYRVFFDYVNSILWIRAVTRGVNKGVKEDFRAALERQICRSDDGFEPFLKAFFQDEKESLLS